VGLVVLAVLFFVWLNIDEKRTRRRYEAEGVPVIGWIVQANDDLYAPGNFDKPAQILVCFDAEANPPDSFMAKLAERVVELKGEDPDRKAEAKVARLVNDETYQPFKRFLLPKEFTGGREVYSMHVWVQRALLPERVLQYVFVRCLVLENDQNSRPLMVEYKKGDKKFRGKPGDRHPDDDEDEDDDDEE
jgi:hypothetical protein